MSILKWLAGHDTGSSSNAIALTALGEMPDSPAYPHDGDDFGRCYRLLALYPEAKAGLRCLGVDGGDVWKALVARWPEIETAYLYDVELLNKGIRNHNVFKCYSLMQSIIRPIEDAKHSVIRGKDFSIHIKD